MIGKWIKKVLGGGEAAPGKKSEKSGSRTSSQGKRRASSSGDEARSDAPNRRRSGGNKGDWSPGEGAPEGEGGQKKRPRRRRRRQADGVDRERGERKPRSDRQDAGSRAESSDIEEVSVGEPRESRRRGGGDRQERENRRDGGRGGRGDRGRRERGGGGRRSEGRSEGRREREGGRGGRRGAAVDRGHSGDPGMVDPAYWTAEDPTGIEIPDDYSFAELDLAEPLVRAVASMGYEHPTNIQSEAIPAILAGRDLVGASQTGTGKTAAFMLPVLTKMEKHGALRCLILEPTRELAAQIEEAIVEFSRFLDIRCALLHGGVGYGTQTELLKRGVDIVVATPGRLLDHLERGTFSLENIDYLILDEVDRMLDMGFLPDVRRIIDRCKKDRQTLFFSATMPPQIETLASFAVKDPLRIEVGRRFSPAETVSHAFYPVAADQREELLLALLKETDYHSVMIFTRTKAEADSIYATLNEDPDHKVTVMHSDIKQTDRTRALQGFRAGDFDIIVATDVAARGLDITDVTHVINFRVPENPEDYVHRIGRTGRACKEGDAFTLLSGEELDFAKSVERLIGSAVDRRKLEGFDYIYTALLDDGVPSDPKALKKALGRARRGGGGKRRRRLRA